MTVGWPRFDKRLVQRKFDRAAAEYDRAATVQRRMADEVVERLEFIKLVPERIVDVGCGTGYLVRCLQRSYRRATILGLDLSVGMLAQARARERRFRRRARWVNADAEMLPLADASVDLVVSTATLQWCDLVAALGEFRRVLRPGGLLMFASFGPDTLKEVRRAWATTDDGVHVHRFLDMHDVGDALLMQGFADPVMDVDRLQIEHANVADALGALKQIGATNTDGARARGLTGRARFQRFVDALEAARRDGRLLTTYEVVYGHAWCAAVQPGAVSDTEVAIPLSSITRR